MKGLILAAGNGSRTGLPFSKCLLAYEGKTIVELLVQKMIKSGISEVGVVIGENSGWEIFKVLWPYINGGGVRVFFQKKPLGVAHAIMQAAGFLDEDFLVAMGDNWFEEDFREYLEQWTLIENAVPTRAAFATFLEMPAQKALDYAVFMEDDTLIEKPKAIKESFAKCYCGVMVMSAGMVGHKCLDELKPSGRGEYELVDLWNMAEYKCKIPLVGGWYDVGNLDYYAELLKAKT